MLTAYELKNYILNGLACDYAEVQGDDGQHFEAVVVSPLFAGKTRVQQHQQVYQALGNPCAVAANLHARGLGEIRPSVT